MSSVPLGGGPFSEVDRLKSLVGRQFTIYETRATPQSLIFLVNVDGNTLEEKFNSLCNEMWPLYYVPQIRMEAGEYMIEVVRRPQRTPWSGTVNWIMLILTIVSTVFAGSFLWLAYIGGSTLRLSDLLWGGVFFAVPLLTILGLHELAHFFMARYHKVEASLPFFLPMPPPYVPLGTFGAFISLRQPIPTKKALMDIGVSGPLAGFAVAIPVILLGLSLSTHSTPLPLSNCGPVILGIPYGGMMFGSSLIWAALSLFFPAGIISLHPLAIAGWVGVLVTAINLLPAGQLDGGHVFRALLGKNSVWLSLTVVVLLIGLGVFFGYLGWFLFAFLVLILGVRHPPPLNDLSPLDLKRKGLGIAAAVVLVCGFSIIPISTPSGDFSGNLGHNGVAVTPFNKTSTQANMTFTVVNNDIVDHDFSFWVNMTAQNLSGTQLASFFTNMSCNLAIKGSNWSCNATASWPYLYLYSPLFPLHQGGDSTKVTIEIVDPMPVHMVGTLYVDETCGAVQDLPNGGEQNYPINY